jgi:hypothetical protein
MTTEEMERLLVSALHEADSWPVTTGRARTRLLHSPERHRREFRWWTIAGVLACAVVVLIATVITGVGHDVADQRPAPPTHHVHLSPSGLPVGLLTAPLDLQTPNGIPGKLRLFVRADGSGQYGVFTGVEGDDEGFDVTLEPLGAGQFAMRSDAAGCGTEPAMTATFTVSRTSVTFGEVTASGACLVSREIAAALTGLTATVQSLPESAP